MKRGAVVGLVVAGVLVLGVGGAVVATSMNRDEASTATESSAPAEQAAPDSDSASADSPDTESTSSDATASDSASTGAGGAYVDYSEEALASAEGTRLLFFYASWCPKCRALDADIQASGVPEGYTILKVDYDTNQDLRREYGVTQQTTVVALDESGESTGLHVAYEDTTVNGVFSALDLSR